MPSISRLFEESGHLSDNLSKFELRTGQIELASAIENAIKKKSNLVAEAGTGIGKTFSYLLPALSNNKKTFVSTATKHLQDQIFFKDLPIIEKVLKRKVSACLLKGRANYFCHQRFSELEHSATQLTSKQLKKVYKIKEWSDKTLSGDLSEIVEFEKEDTQLLKKITSTTDNCYGGECPAFEQCFVQKVREKAKKSEIVILNHALLMADIVLKETGFAEILPDSEVVIIDEAHQLAKVATQAFSEQVTSNQLFDLIVDASKLYKDEGSGLDYFIDNCNELNTSIQNLSIELEKISIEGKIRLAEIKQHEEVYSCFKEMMRCYHEFLISLKELAEQSKNLAHLNERAVALGHTIKNIFTLNQVVDKDKASNNTFNADDSNNFNGVEQNKNINQSIDQDANQITSQNLESNIEENVEQDINRDVGNNKNQNYTVSLLSWNRNYFNASKMPINLGNRFLYVMQDYAASWIFVSATLTIADSFVHYLTEMGLYRNTETLKINSPFDYEKNAVIHVLEHLPDPRDVNFTKLFVNACKPIIEACAGRTFLLFTSYKALNEGAQILAKEDFNLFVQGDMPKSQLIDAFIKTDNAVLLGTLSFWEGVDVAGKNLSAVMIDKIPFPSPGDPIIEEQSNYLERQGKSSFALCYIPKAATLLKQGAGRLIRSKTDKGIMIFGDKRMVSKSYGKQLIKSLPPARIVNADELIDFIKTEL